MNQHKTFLSTRHSVGGLLPGGCGKAGLGFTLIELMLTVAMIGLLAVFAAPNFLEFIQKQRVNTRTSMISDMFAHARAEAVSNLQVTSVCWNSGNSSKTVSNVSIAVGEMVVIGGNPVAELRSLEYAPSNVSVVDDDSDQCIQFDTQGRMIMASVGAGKTGLNLAVCKKSGEDSDSRVVTVSRTGRALTQDNYNDGTPLLGC